MRRVIENQDIRSLERELKSQYVRYQLAIKDGALDSIVAEVISRIAQLEGKIETMKKENENEKEMTLAYS